MVRAVRSIGGKRADLGGLYLRSRMEANFARVLNFLKERKKIKDWQYEPDTFEFKAIKKGTRFYTPDFKVFNNDDTVHYEEVKGWLDAKSKTQLKRMQKYYPDVKVKLLDVKRFKRIERQISAFIKTWER